MGRTPSLAELAALQGDTDIGDRDTGDLDPTEVQTTVPDVRHESHRLATPPCTCGPTETGREYLRRVVATCKATPKPPGHDPARSEVRWCVGWREAPKPVRAFLVRGAGLTADVADKMDRELTETEKAMLRAAASRLRDWASALAGL